MAAKYPTDSALCFGLQGLCLHAGMQLIQPHANEITL